jgi:hypothetical protein
LAKWLGISPQAVSKMERRGVSRVVALAMAAIDRGLQPCRPTKEDCEAANMTCKASCEEDENEG